MSMDLIVYLLPPTKRDILILPMKYNILASLSNRSAQFRERGYHLKITIAAYDDKNAASFTYHSLSTGDRQAATLRIRWKLRGSLVRDAYPEYDLGALV